MGIAKRRTGFIVMAICLLFCVFFLCCGFTVSGEATLGDYGKGSITLTVESEKNLEDVRSFVQERAKYFALRSGDVDMIKVTSVKGSDGAYTVTLKTRRIDKIQAYTSGSDGFQWAKFSEYLVSDVTDEEEVGDSALGKIANGNIAGTYDGFNGKAVRVARKSGLKVAVYSAEGEEKTVEELLTDAGKNAKKHSVFLMKAAGLEGLVSVRISFPGKIRYYAGAEDNVTLVDKSTLLFRTVPITGSEIVVDGADVTTQTKSVPAVAGFVVFDKNLSPAAIAVIVIAGIAAAGLTTAVLVYFHVSGKKLIEEENGKGGVHEEERK